MGESEPMTQPGTAVTVSRRAYDAEQATIAISQIDLLAELAEGQLLRGNVDPALRISGHAARRALAVRPHGADSSRAARIRGRACRCCFYMLFP